MTDHDKTDDELTGWSEPELLAPKRRAGSRPAGSCSGSTAGAPTGPRRVASWVARQCGEALDRPAMCSTPAPGHLSQIRPFVAPRGILLRLPWP
jgi:hypothetical protein